MRIYLIGYMASGKSNFGRKLASKLGYPFLDLDDLFEERYRVSVLDFFEKYDETVFRNLERSLLLETISHDHAVISTGGGTPCFFDNMQVIRQSGVSIYLCWQVNALVQRLMKVKRKRPLLKDLPANELYVKVEMQLKQREPFYNQADIIIDGQEIDLDKLLPLIKGFDNDTNG
jgi:shikimate kinase